MNLKNKQYKERSEPELAARRKLFGQILLDMKLITDEQMQEALKVQKNRKGMIGDILVRLKYITSEQILDAVSKFLGMRRVDISRLELPADAIGKIPQSIAQIYRIVPISYKDGVLEVAQENVLKLDQLRDITLFFGYKISGVVCPYEDVRNAIEKYYPIGKHESFDKLLGDVEYGKPAGLQSGDHDVIDLDIEELKTMAEIAPVKSFVNTILLHAVKEGASDIHFEPFDDEFVVRYRIDNTLYQKASPPNSFGMGIITRIKVMSNLNISERRLPQDGRIKLRIMGSAIEFRVSCLPTKFGESVVLRIFDKGVASMDFENLGLQGKELKQVTNLLRMPNGIILVTGPTGSGKTSTLYAVLHHKNTTDVKIITTEDPVENEIEGIMQIPINPNVGATFAASLRAVLRQDPDIILVGEIRDEETAQIAVQAALTGHLVFSTLHTNDSPSTISRLVDMGIQPFLISATLQAVISQRLIRRICLACKREQVPDEMVLKNLKLTSGDIVGRKFYHGAGCDKCRKTGYKGRVAIYEIMEMNDDISALITRNASVSEIRSTARKSGMVTLRECGLRVAYDGITTLEQVLDETVTE